MKKYLISFILILLFSLKIVNAEELIKVGYFRQPGYQEYTPDGERYGYIIEYLQYISQTTGWDYEFFDSTFEKCVEMLQNREIDLMGCVMYTPERAETFALPNLDSGIVYTSLFTKASSDIAYNDFAAFNGKKVGVRGGVSKNINDLINFSSDNGFSVTPVYYDDINDIRSAVSSGEVDLGVIAGFEPDNTERVVANFSPTPFYFALNKNSTELLSKLNLALSTIKINDPFFDSKLKAKYNPKGNYKTVLSAKEKEYVNSGIVLRVVWCDERYLLESKNKQTDDYSGIAADIFEQISNKTGLHFEYLEAESYNKAIELVKENKADLIAYYNFNFESAENDGLVLSDAYLSIPLVIIGKESFQPDCYVATPIYFTNRDAININGIKDFVLYDTYKQCLDAVLNNKVAYALLYSYSADFFKSKNAYSSLKITPLQNTSFDVCMGISKNISPLALSVINKGIVSLSTSEINDFIFNNAISGQKISLQTIAEQMPTDVVFFATVLLALTVLALSIFLINRVKYASNIKNIFLPMI